MLLYALSNGIQYIGYNCVPLVITDQSFSNDATVGFSTAIGAVFTIIAQFFWGRIADRSRSKNRILVLVLIGMSLSAVPFLFSIPSKAALYIYMALFYFFFLTPQSMVDTICIENLHKTKKPFGLIRTASPGLGVLLALSMLLFPGLTAKRMILIFILCPLLAIIPTLLLPNTAGHGRITKDRPREKGAVLKLLKNKRLLLLLAFGLFGCTFGNIPTTYFPVYYSTESGLNAGTSMLGAFFAIAIFLEVCVLIVGTKLVKKLNPYIILAILLLTNAVRMFLIFIIQDPSLMLVTTILQAFWFGMMFSVATPLIYSIVPPEYSATGQSMWVLTAFGIAQILSNLLSGVLANLMPIRYIFLVSALGFVVLFFILGPLYLKQAREDRKLSAGIR